jgi:hypothetical protein
MPTWFKISKKVFHKLLLFCISNFKVYVCVFEKKVRSVSMDILIMYICVCMELFLSKFILETFKTILWHDCLVRLRNN